MAPLAAGVLTRSSWHLISYCQGAANKIFAYAANTKNSFKMMVFLAQLAITAYSFKMLATLAGLQTGC